jgi:F-type H+-transporting ATPase subunit epsilon
MARNRFVVEVLTPDGEVFNEEVEMVSTRTTVGSIGLLANHEPLLARLEPTELRLYRSETDIVRYAQAEGYVQMSDNHALLLVEEALEPARLNVAELSERVEAARRAHEAAPAGSEEAARADRDRRRAEAFLAIASGAH